MAYRPSPTLLLAEEIEASRRAGQDALSLSTPSFPEVAINASPLLPGANKLTPALGLPELRAHARPNLFRRWKLPEHEILISAGAKLALFSALKSTIPTGSTVLIVEPAWPSYSDLIEMAGHTSQTLATSFANSFAIERQQLETAMQVSGASAIVLSNPSNPTGRIYSVDELELLLSVAEKHNAYLLLDESFSDIRFSEEAWQSSVARSSARLLVFNSFSKNHHLQGLRVAACLAHESVLSGMVAVHQTMISAAPSVSQMIALSMLQHKNGSPVADSYHSSRKIAAQIIEAAGWRTAPNCGTFYYFPKLPQAQETFNRLRESGLYPLEGGAFGNSYVDHMRFCFGKPVEEMRAIRDRMSKLGLLRIG